MKDKKQKNQIVKLKYFGIPKLLPFLKPYRKKLIFMVAIGLATSCIDIIVPLFQRYAIDNYIVTKVLDTLPLFAVLYGLTLGAQVLFSVTSLYTAQRVEMSISRDLKQKVLRSPSDPFLLLFQSEQRRLRSFKSNVRYSKDRRARFVDDDGLRVALFIYVWRYSGNALHQMEACPYRSFGPSHSGNTHCTVS